MIAFHFPPWSGGSGIQRTLRFVQHLPAQGWQPLVLSASPLAYQQTGADLLAEVPRGTVVQRSFALDAARHLSIKGRYLGWTARPDRWMSWQWAAVRDGMRMIQAYRPDAIWSTYPIATAHHIGAELQRRSGLPWVADFRDPMAQDGYPSDPAVWKCFKAIEIQAMARAAHCVFTTPGAASAYSKTYPAAASRISVVENGYDEESFAGLERPPAATKRMLNPGKWTLLHSGLVYPSERDPTQFFAALALVVQRGDVNRDSLRVRFRAPVHADLLKDLAQRYGITDMVEICPPVSYRDALSEMVQADGLLVMQASNCNAQIPAKLYEYLRSGTPVMGLTDLAGDTAQALRSAGITALAPLDSTPRIADALVSFLSDLRQGTSVLPHPAAVASASRRARAQQLAALLQCAATPPMPPTPT